MMEQPERDALGPAHRIGETSGNDIRGLGDDSAAAAGNVDPSAAAAGNGGAGAAVRRAAEASDESAKLRAVMRDFGPMWEIERVPPGAAWVAVTRRGSWVHVIAAHDLDTLRTKIETAQREETSPAPGPSPS